MKSENRRLWPLMPLTCYAIIIRTQSRVSWATLARCSDDALCPAQSPRAGWWSPRTRRSSSASPWCCSVKWTASPSPPSRGNRQSVRCASIKGEFQGAKLRENRSKISLSVVVFLLYESLIGCGMRFFSCSRSMKIL